MPHFEETVHGVENSSLEPIAIVGMACRLPGAVDSAPSLWDLLLKKGSGQTPKVPESRFNIDAHFHEDLERPGSFNVPGGYFLNGPVENFDPSFFNVTPIEAMWMDPQQRKMLEVSYECLESAGLSIEAVAGSNTAVYVGSFTSDYQQMSIRDTDFRHNYAATGVDPGIISNRIGNTFDLRGPSFTINTACSSSVYAIHNACHSLRARDCEAAIAGGVNLIITVDQHMNTAKLGILSPTSTCHTFDISADGYGRAEGAGALYLKRLSDAIRDGDPVRGVIRSSAVNTNGKVPGMGITHPSVTGQERVMRAAYARANLDPSKTAYLECHGTGTPVGDPIEVKAVSNAMNDTRSSQDPLLIGAIKANIGHSEAASGIFAVMKAAMMTEAGIIPGVAGFKTLNPASMELELLHYTRKRFSDMRTVEEDAWNVKVQAETRKWPKDSLIRRASVNSFGYGGTNGHVIVEGVNSLYPWYWHGKTKADASYDHSAPRPFLIVFSAHDNVTLSRNILAHGKIADRFYLADLAYTLNLRRSRFSQRAFTIATEGNETQDFALSSFKFGAARKQAPKLGFIFTGQGAQWAGMGAEAMKTFPSFLETIKALDRVLHRLESPPSWKLEETILAPEEISKINDAEISQPVCTAVQIAIVDLFSEWDIIPSATVGHSSGEIGAAYAAGLLSAPEAILAAFYRGLAVKCNAPLGTMLAVAVGVKEISKYTSGLSEDVVIACENSPSSVTLSGTIAAIQVAKARFDADGILAKELRTGKAYHSPQMSAVAPMYNHLLSQATRKLHRGDLDWHHPRVKMISSVTGEEFQGEHVPIQYWSDNLRNRVLFDSAFTNLTRTSGLEEISCFIEIGPHPALAGPFKQICKANGYDRFAHIPTFIRKTDSTSQLLKAAGELFIQNYPLDLERVNAVDNIKEISAFKKSQKPAILVDLPPYQWNYEKTYWAEPRFSQEQRFMRHARHDLLGSKVGGLSDRSLVWRNLLRHRDVPWLRDHKLGNVAVFPAAGHLSLAIEALRQVSEANNVQISGVTFRDVAINIALVIPDTDDGIEVQLRLQQSPKVGNSYIWHSFAVESVTDGKWTLHCEGMIAANYNLRSASCRSTSPVALEKLTQRMPGKRWYDAFRRVGFEYGPSFQGLRTIRTDSKYHEAAADVAIVTQSGLMKGESRYILHPSTIDACFQLIIVSINTGLHKDMPWGVVPIRIEEISLWFPGEEVGSMGHAVAWTDDLSARYFNTHTQLMTKSGNQVMDVKNLRCVAYEAAIPQHASKVMEREPYLGISWKPDIDTLTALQLRQAYPETQSESGLLCKLVELLNHKNPLTSVFLVGQRSLNYLNLLMDLLPSNTLFTVGDTSTERLESLESTIADKDRISTLLIPTEGSYQWDASMIKSLKLLVIDDSFNQSEAEARGLQRIKPLVADEGKVIFSVSSQAGDSFAKKLPSYDYSEPELRFDLPATTLILSNPVKPPSIRVMRVQEEATFLFLNHHSPMLEDLAEQLTTKQCNVQVKDIANFDASKDRKIIIDDIQGKFLSSLNPHTFSSLKAVLSSGAPIIWLTAGVNEGKSVHGSMSQGFLRAIRSEQAMAKITGLDFDTTAGSESVACSIMDKMGTVATKDSGSDTEFWLHGGVLQVSRYVPNNALNDRSIRTQKLVEEVPLPVKKGISGKLTEEGLVFRSRFPSEQISLNQHEVELQVYASESDKTDLQAQAEGPRIVVGKIIEVGNSLNPSLIGKEGVAYTTEGYSTVVRLPACLGDCFEGFNAPDLAGTLPSLCNVVNALVHTANVKDYEHVLLLPAPAPFIGAAVRLSRALGFTLTVVVDTQKEKEECLSSLGLSSDAVVLGSEVTDASIARSSNKADEPNIVVAHEFSTFSREIWRSIPPMARFVLNDGTLNEALDVLPFTKGAAFFSTGIDTVYKRDPKVLGDVLKRALALLNDHKDLMVKNSTSYDIGILNDLAAVSQAATSPDNAVVTYNYGKSPIKIQDSNDELRFSADASYLLVGCLGGLGRSLTSWMMGRGAKNFAFISRSGTDKAEAAQLVESLKRSGASVEVFRADASNLTDVERVVSNLNAISPIRGVVHAAMVLQDAIFERMTYEQFTAAIVPKVEGALNIHKALQGTPLDFFVMTSSISATLGTPGQCNYCAGNSFLDSLAWNRNLQGLPAVSLILPMILDVGYVAEHQDIEASLSRKGMYGIDEREMLRGFETAMLQPPPSSRSSISIGDAQFVLGLEPAYLSAAISSVDSVDAFWYNDARFNSLRIAVEDASKASSSGKGAGSDFTALLKAAVAESPEAALQATALYVVKKLSSILMVPLEDFDLDGASVADHGLDSMIGAELRNWLFKEFGLDMSFQLLLAPTLTIKELSAKVAESLGVLKKEGDA